MVEKQLQAFEMRLERRIDEWTASTLQGCQEMGARLDTLEGIEGQLKEVERTQKGLQYSLDVIYQRLDRLEASGLRAIPEGPAALDWPTVDSARSVPRAAQSRSFAETRDEWEKQV